MQYLNSLSYGSTNLLFYSHFSASPRVQIKVLIIRYLQDYSKKSDEVRKELLSLVTFKEYATLMGVYLEWHPN